MIKLKIASLEDEQIIKDYVEQFQQDGELIEGNVGMIQYMNYPDWIYVFSDSKTDRSHLILVDGQMVGTIDFRFTINPLQSKSLGMIGYAITPKARSKGYASQALKIAIDSYPAQKIIITCLKENKASARVIENAGGILQKEFFFDGEPSLRYLIIK